MDDQIAALLHELERHELAGRVERVAAIRDELAGLGYQAKRSTPVETTSAPRGRKK